MHPSPIPSVFVAVALGLTAMPAAAVSKSFRPAADNTLVESATDLSNGAGTSFFTGRVGRRRFGVDRRRWPRRGCHRQRRHLVVPLLPEHVLDDARRRFRAGCLHFDLGRVWWQLCVGFDIVARAGRARITVFDARGAMIAKLFDGAKPAGEHTVVWDGRDHRDVAVVSGVYVVQLESDGVTRTQRVVLAK